VAEVLSEKEFTLLFHEGRDSNLHVVQVTDQVLLLIAFGHDTQVGRVRLYTTRALEVLKTAFESAEDEDESGSPMGAAYSREARGAIDGILPDAADSRFGGR
jgi:hypothetical protein